MLIQSKPYGPVEIEERQKITFPQGIFGFEYLKEYALLDASQKPFYWLQSLEEPEIAFVLIDPLVFRPDYSPDVSDAELDSIELESADDENIIVFSIVTIPENQERMTANLQGPVIVNKKNHRARQCISNNPSFKTRHYIVDEIKASRGSPC